MKRVDCGTCLNSFPDFYIEEGDCPKCSGFTNDELSDNLKEIYENINERNYDNANDPYPEVEMN